MTGYVVAFLIAAPLSGAWVWAVARYGGVRFPPVDLVLTIAICSAVGVLPRVGWLIATMILVMIALRVEQAEPWPETVILAAGPMVIWFFAGMALFYVSLG
jgi:hypothetical protein